MSYRFSDIIDILHLKKLLHSFYELTRIPITVIDIDGNILSGEGWQDICTKFHRVCPQAEYKCKQSDSYISDHLHDGPFIGYKCLNGLMDYSTPIIVEGRHLATLFTGQCLHEPPEEEFFRRQAWEYGFDETAYIEALHRVPVIPEDRVESIMAFFSQLAQLLAAMGLERLRQLEVADQSLREREERLRLVLEGSNGGFWDWNIETGEVYFSPRWGEILGYSLEEIEPHVRTWVKLVHPDDMSLAKKAYNEHLEGRTPNFEIEHRLLTKAGDWKWVLDCGKVVARNEHGKPLRVAGTYLDITERKQLEKEMARLDRLNLVGEMAASIGHEVRNPMTTVRGFLQVLQEKEGCIKYREYFNLMVEELDRANSIITEYLTLAKNKAVDLKVQIRTFVLPKRG